MGKSVTEDDLERRYKAVKSLPSHEGWALFIEFLDEQERLAVAAMTSPNLVNTDVVNFQRGAVWALAQLRNAPNILLSQVESDYQLGITATATRLESEPL